MIEIQQYKPDCIQVWNQYVHNSKNGTFLSTEIIWITIQSDFRIFP